MTEERSPLYAALLQAMGVTEDSVVATAWGRDYTLIELESMTPRERKIMNWKLRSYNLWLRLLLVISNIRVWFWRTALEIVVGIRTLLGL